MSDSAPALQKVKHNSPFRIVKQVNSVAYELHLPPPHTPHYRIQPTFHVSQHTIVSDVWEPGPIDKHSLLLYLDDGTL